MRSGSSTFGPGWLMLLALLAILTIAGAAGTAAEEAGAPAAAHPLVWDAMEKVLEPAYGHTSAAFQFTVTNTSQQSVTIEQIRPTCGCTVAEMPASPWEIAAGGAGTFTGTIDFAGKDRIVRKALYIHSTAGVQLLHIAVKVPRMDDEQRRMNQLVAQKNRQAVFAAECASCHLEPAQGLKGAALFTKACGVCHFSPHRSDVVPDLLVARSRRDDAFWRTWIADGKEGTLMPAWAKQHGGPLTDEQIDSLVDFALKTLPTEPPQL